MIGSNLYYPEFSSTLNATLEFPFARKNYKKNGTEFKVKWAQKSDLENCLGTNAIHIRIQMGYNGSLV